jgi:hypothetical protein
VTEREGPAPPPLDAVLAVDPSALSGKLLAIPDEENALLRLADGRRTVKELLDGSGLDERLALASLGRLLDGGVLRVLSRGPDGADWFADPGAAATDEPESAGPTPGVPAPAAESPPEPPAEPPPEEAPAVGAARPGRARARLGVAAVVLGALILAGAVWVRRQRVLSQLPQASAARTERRGAETPPPALLVTEPAPSAAYRQAMAEVGARHQAGDLAGAAAACQRAIDLDPSIGSGWMALGEVRLAAGDREGARSAFERYLAVEPEGRNASRVRELLRRLRP